MNWTSYIEHYRSSHTHPVNRWTHAFGIPMIVLSLPLFWWSWPWATGLFVAGWGLQLLGHAVEGKPPAFLKNPAYLLVGPFWWFKKIFHLEGKKNHGIEPGKTK